MTTIDQAATSHVPMRMTLATLAALMAVGLSACETSTSLLSDNTGAPATVAPQTTAKPADASRIAIAPVIGAPEGVSKDITAQLTDALGKKRISVAAGANDRVEYTLRGYVVAAKERNGVKVSYIWDVTDTANKRVNRITGEELVAGGASKDAWASVTPQVIRNVTEKTASSLSAWLPAQTQAAVANAPVGVGAPPAGPQVAGALTTEGSQGGSQQVAAVSGNGSATTGSIGREGGVAAVVPSVTGAPGDGSVSLTAALQRELSRGGVTITERRMANTYQVEGKVAVGEGRDGKQPISIDWLVKDAQGNKLGTVSQKNEIAAGSLDGRWGGIAEAAAAAAAQGILKLMPPARAVN